jgi:hypothetical protein
VDLPPRKLFFSSRQEPSSLKTPCVYSISCECVKVYIGQTGPSVETRVKEHQRHIRLAHPEKSAVAEHSINLGLHNTSILAKKSIHGPYHQGRDRLSSIQTALIGRKDGFFVNKTWKPLIRYLRERKTGCKHEHDALRWALKRAVFFPQSTPYPGPSLEPNSRLPIGPYPGPIFLSSDWLPPVNTCPSGPI